MPTSRVKEYVAGSRRTIFRSAAKSSTRSRLRDKVLLVLSQHSIKSDWVEDEVKTAFDEERKRGQIVLFPIRLDDVVMETKEAWAAKLRADRHIGDFRRWTDHDAYKQSFKRAVRDLTLPPTVT
jgi:TIR domain